MKRPHRHPRLGQKQAAKSRFMRELYQDDALLVVDKPAGLLAVPVKGLKIISALSLISAELKKRGQRGFTVHRIDRFASGILLFAKTVAARNKLIQQFLAHSPVRQYLAVVRGHLPEKQGRLVHYFRREGMFQKLSHERDRRAARAELTYSVERELRGASLVRVTLLTGLQNQIRVQFAASGHPLIGDRKYSPKEAEEGRIARVALHATHLEVIHPRSGERVIVDCEPPCDFQSLVRALSLPTRKS
jgi:RluA family pseudouridine synthase